MYIQIQKNYIIPVEVKSGRRTNSKSLNKYIKKYNQKVFEYLLKILKQKIIYNMYHYILYFVLIKTVKYYRIKLQVIVIQKKFTSKY